MSLLAELRTADLISPAYLETQVFLHAQPRGYGGKGSKWATAVMVVAQRYECLSVLDYGAGEGTLGKALRASGKLAIAEYDPAIVGKDHLPAFADLVVSTDVLEHVEKERLSTVLAHIKLLARKAAFVVVATRPSNKTLPDGRNAHLIVEDADWWRERLQAAGFNVAPGPSSPSVKPSRELSVVLT